MSSQTPSKGSMLTILPPPTTITTAGSALSFILSIAFSRILFIFALALLITSVVMCCTLLTSPIAALPAATTISEKNYQYVHIKAKKIACIVPVVVIVSPPNTKASLVKRCPTDSGPTTIPSSFCSTNVPPPRATETTSGIENELLTPPISTQVPACRGNPDGKLRRCMFSHKVCTGEPTILLTVRRRPLSCHQYQLQ